MEKIIEETMPPYRYLGAFVDKNIRTFRKPKSLLQDFQDVLSFANENNITVSGHRVAIYISKPGSLNSKLFVGYRVLGEVEVADSGYTLFETEESTALTVMHRGDHSTLKDAHKHMHDAIAKRKGYINKYIIEEYVLYSTVESDSNRWKTKIYYYTTTKRPSEEESGLAENKFSVLILEDEEMFSDALSMFLVESGFEVVVTKNGDMAQEMVDERSFDLALLDLLVPGVDGFEVLKSLRKKQPEIPIFILSNLEEDENKEKAMQLGANKYFFKSETLLSDVTKEISDVFKK